MRFLSRLHLCAGASLVLIFYTVLHRSAYAGPGISTIWHSKSHRIVVFGDDWSDTGSYRVSPPPQSSIATRDPDRGDLWVEALCNELQCDIENYARCLPSSSPASEIGSLVDSDLYMRATAGKNDDSIGSVSFDFKTQVQQFLDYSKGHRFLPGRQRRIDRRTIFTVYFGLWDLLGYRTLQRDFAMRAIEYSIADIFQELDTIAKHATEPIQVVIPRMMDITFLPRFQATRNDVQDHFAEHQHHLVFLTRYWNDLLSQAAKNWKNGNVYMPDPNALIMNQVRATQMRTRFGKNATSDNDQIPLFEYIEQPCLVLNPDDEAPDSTVAVVEKCYDPAQHLFWNDLHLSGIAHDLIGRRAASLLRDNHTINMHIPVETLAQDSNSGKADQSKFDLKFPPGY